VRIPCFKTDRRFEDTDSFHSNGKGKENVVGRGQERGERSVHNFRVKCEGCGWEKCTQL
jgi:hypothetical protein